jgi:hypothetical protein
LASITSMVRRSWLAAVIPAVAGLALAAAAIPASAATAHAARPGVRVGHTIRLTGANEFSVFTEAPNGSVYYTHGGTVYVVNGNSGPSPVTALRSPVLALAANRTFLFVQTGRTVYEYKRSTEAYAGHTWTLPVPARTTSDGMVAAGGTLWSWVDYATDESGFQYATASVLITSTGHSKVISKNNVYPGDVTAGPADLYFETVRGDGANGYIDLATPTGSVRRHSDVNLDAPAALAGGRLDLLAVHDNNSRTYVDSFSDSTLATRSSRPVSGDYRDVAGTSAGLLVLKEPCASFVCKYATVGVLNPATGAVSRAVRVSYGYTLLSGPVPAALSTSGGKIYLVRLAG